MSTQALDTDLIEPILRWAMVEMGTAGLSDRLGREVLAPQPPTRFLPAEATVAGPVLLLRRERPRNGAPGGSSFPILRQTVRPGVVILVHCDLSIGAAFGSNIALQAAMCRAQAMVTDGAWRDLSRLRTLGFVLGANGATAAKPAGYPYVASESEDMFGMTWHTGDWFLRDGDGVIRLSPEAAATVAAELASEASGELAALLGRP